jgi:hypothetical protein
MVIAWLASTSSAAPLGCEQPVDPAGLDAVVARAEKAIADLDPTGLSTAERDATEAVRCLAVPPAPELLARFFRVRGVAAFAAHDDGRARAAFAAARALDPELGLDPVLQGPIAELFATADVDGSAAPLPPPPAGQLYVDAEPAGDVPVRRTSLVQLVDNGEVRQTWIVEPGDPLPVVAVLVPVPVPTPAPMPAPVPEEPVVARARTSRGLLAAGLATGLAGGLAAGGAALAEQSYKGSTAPADEVRDTLALNRGLSVASYGLFAGAGGLGLAAVVVGRW